LRFSQDRRSCYARTRGSYGGASPRFSSARAGVSVRVDQQRGSGVVSSVPRRRLRHGEPQRPRPARQRRLTRRQLSHAAAAALTAASTSPGDAEDTSAKGSPRKGLTAWKTGPEPFALRLGLLTSRTSRWFLSLSSPPTTGASGFSVRQRSESLRRMEYLTMPGWRSRCRLTHPRCAGRSSGGPRSQA